jgi:hypothetical protein
VRRLGLFAGFLLLLGLTTAVAASFSVQAEDITSFSTPVSITPPAPIPFPATIYLGGSGSAAMGDLQLVPPSSNNPVQSRLVIKDTASVEAQAGPTKFATWRTTPPTPTSGYLLTGTVVLMGIEQNKGPDNRMTAALMNCPASAPASSTSPAPCTHIKTAIAPASTGNGNGYLERTVNFGFITPTTIPFGNELRLKIVNQEAAGGTTLSVNDWDVQWGFLPSRQSTIEIGP